MNCCSREPTNCYGGDDSGDNTLDLSEQSYSDFECVCDLFTFASCVTHRAYSRSAVEQIERRSKSQYIYLSTRRYTHTYSWNTITASSEQRSHLHRSNGGGGSLFDSIWQRQPRWLWQRRQPQSIGIHSAWAFVKKTLTTMKPVYLIRCVQQMKKTTQYLYRTHKCPLNASNNHIELICHPAYLFSTCVRLLSRILFPSEFLVSFSLSGRFWNRTHKHTCSHSFARLWSKWRWCYLHSVTARFFFFLPSLFNWNSTTNDPTDEWSEESNMKNRKKTGNSKEREENETKFERWNSLPQFLNFQWQLIRIFVRQKCGISARKWGEQK